MRNEDLSLFTFEPDQCCGDSIVTRGKERGSQRAEKEKHKDAWQMWCCLWVCMCLYDADALCISEVTSWKNWVQSDLVDLGQVSLTHHPNSTCISFLLFIIPLFYDHNMLSYIHASSPNLPTSLLICFFSLLLRNPCFHFGLLNWYDPCLKPRQSHRCW